MVAQSKEIRVPPLGESVSEATIARWLKQPGQQVAQDEPLVELETDKVTLEVNAPMAGFLGEINAPQGTTVAIGDLLGSITAETGQGAVSDGKPAAAPEPVALVQAPTPTVAEPVAPTGGAPIMAPSARKLAEEQDLNVAALKGTGKDGRITKSDVLTFTQDRGRDAAPSIALEVPVAASLPQSSRISAAGAEERVKMTRLRQRIAQRLKEAQNTAAMLTTFNEIDMTNVTQARNTYRDAFEKKYGVRLGFMSFFVRAAVLALKEIPAVNAEMDGDDLVYKNHYDIGVAVAAPQGLVVPVVRNADHLSFAEIESAIGDLSKKAREGKLSMEDLTGGTFTITNGGVFGSLMSTPILNPPQSGILGMHKVQQRPVVVDGKIEARPMMYVALTYDHRIIDGREAVTFLVRIKECIENPERLLLGI
ncbi:MAG: 2-oxoglutarate dehydrogenase complex dihydrolipoyllysine-residue succinyltransferase [Holosporales bacterium]